MLSISFLKESDSIHSMTKIAGVTTTNTAKANAILFANLLTREHGARDFFIVSIASAPWQPRGQWQDPQ